MGGHCCETQGNRLISVYHKTNVLGLQTSLQNKLTTWVNNGSCVQNIWKNFKDVIFEGIKRSVPHKSLKPNLDLEYYNMEGRRLKVKVRRAYIKRKLGNHYQAELRRLWMYSNFPPIENFSYVVLHLYPVFPAMVLWLSAAAASKYSKR